MNRMESASFASPVVPHALAANHPDVSAGTIRASGPGGLAVFAPLHYEANYSYPLLVWLHGPRDHEGQLRRIMPVLSLRNYVAVAPRGTVAEQIPGAASPTYAWGDSEDDLFLAIDRVREAIAHARTRFNVNPDRVFLGGYDCGGTMAFRVAMHEPTSFAAVMSVGGRFPNGGRPLSRINLARKVPVFIACGRESQRYPSPRVCEDLRLLHSAGMSVTLRQYPGGHELSPQILSDMDRWMMEEISTACHA